MPSDFQSHTYEVVVARDTLENVVVQPVSDGSDRFWDVLTWRLANDR